MASLADTIRIFQNGGLSPKEFLAQVDRVLASARASSSRLLEILEEEHTNFPLPPDVYAEVHKRIEHLSGPPPAGGDETRVQTSVDPRLDSADKPPPPAGTATAPTSFAGETAPPGDKIKGVGDTLNGRFVLEECLGFGGMGMVYKALDLRKLEASDRNPYIAIKVLNVQFRGHPKSLIALQREAKKAQRLAHPNIVTVYDFDRDGSMIYLTMEYLSGQPLSRVLRAPDFRGMSCAEALKIVDGVGRALAYAHERGFVHCDLKPANVFVTDGGEVKVIDFGIARVFQRPEQPVEATVFDPGSLGGLTPAYASPEMLEHREPDPRDDLYALACITYELLTGRHPFNRVPAHQARAADMKPQRPKGLGRTQWRALRAGLSLQRETRTPTVTQFLREMSGQSATARYLVPAGAVVVIAGLAVAAGMQFRNSREEASEPTRQAAAPLAPAVVAAPAPTTKPADPPPPASPRAAVGALLAAVPCSALSPTFKGDKLAVHGFVPETFGAARLREQLKNVPGIAGVTVDVATIREDQCPVITALGPYWVGNRQAGRPTSVRTQAARGELTEGDPLVVDITTPGYESFVTVDYFVLDGSVVHLVPSRHAKAHQAPPNYEATIGGLGNWIISKPFGSELVVLIATPTPLFDGLRPEAEAGADYLRTLEARLRQLAAQHGADKVSADFVQITTKAKRS